MTAGKMKRCAECRKGSGYRLDLVHIRGRQYRCPRCGQRWKLVGPR